MIRQVIDLGLSCATLWIYLELVWVFLVSIFYFSIPWIIWGSAVLYLLIRFAVRIPPPEDKDVKEVLGINPLVFQLQEDGFLREKEQTENYDNQFCIRVVAHRGLGYDYPENSMTAFRSSHEKGCDAIEFDLTLTKDNIPIIFHDVTTDRVCGVDGKIRELTWNELKKLDISTNHPLRVKFPNGEKIALFEEVVEESLSNGQRMFIDIKATGHEIIKVVLDAYKKYPKLYQRAVISSFNPFTIYMIRKKDPNIVAGLAWRPRMFSLAKYTGIKGASEARYRSYHKHILMSCVDIAHDWALAHVTYYILGLSFLLLHKDVISADAVHTWNQKGIRILAWSVNLPYEKQHFLKNLRVSYLTDTMLS
ncbi:hypothetical protein QAD02_000972 [Eretmocerus hayati]|uniref:Uncharacterized protein n=1 Tax=Eretmocerus hayati TaxID=131215 RepID=A0ACC2NEY6_9HYME|nr:hypothetical protein QAD02_000972 [Eretmocerus hayati]